MKKKLIQFILTFIICQNINSQILFEKGYFIDNSGNKIDCLINNKDWRENPIYFEYKITEDSEVINANIKSIKEFGINNFAKYIRETVKIDKSVENINELSYEKDPVLVEETLFLKVLVEGKSNLFIYENKSILRFFYNNNNNKIEQLINKKYLVIQNRIGENQLFKRQIWNDLKCSAIEMGRVEKLEYEKSSLISIFIDYNKCSNSNYTNYESKVKKDLFNLTPRLHLNNSSLSIQNSIPDIYNTDFGNNSSIGFGVEVELILPFYKNKWSLLIEPTYQYFKVEKTTNISNSTIGLKSTIDYSSIEFPVSLRHYLFLNKDSKIFINGSFVFDLPLNKSIVYETTGFSNRNLKIFESFNLAFGLGYKLKDKYSLEFRYQTNRDLLRYYSPLSSEYKTLSIIIGYSLF